MTQPPLLYSQGTTPYVEPKPAGGYELQGKYAAKPPQGYTGGLSSSQIGKVTGNGKMMASSSQPLQTQPAQGNLKDTNSKASSVSMNQSIPPLTNPGAMPSDSESLSASMAHLMTSTTSSAGMTNSTAGKSQTSTAQESELYYEYDPWNVPDDLPVLFQGKKFT